MLAKFNETAGTLKTKIRSRFVDKPEEVIINEAFKEQKLAFYFLVVSSFLLLLKVGVRLVGEGQWSSFVAAAKDESATALFAVWTFLLSLEWIAMPIFSGIAMAVITWYTVYLDSYIPGIIPPSPLTPQRSRLHARTFHMGYYLAVINGIILAAVLLHTNLTQPI